MRRLLDELGSFFANKMNCVLICIFVFGFIGIGGNIYAVNELKSTKVDILNAVNSAEEKVDYRYFNLTHSLQDIHKVKIETHHGRVEK